MSLSFDANTYFLVGHMHRSSTSSTWYVQMIHSCAELVTRYSRSPGLSSQRKREPPRYLRLMKLLGRAQWICLRSARSPLPKNLHQACLKRIFSYRYHPITHDALQIWRDGLGALRSCYNEKKLTSLCSRRCAEYGRC
jgi:hypothetical protein